MEKLISAAEFARRTGLPNTTVWRYVKDGAIRNAQPGGPNKRRWIAEAEVDRINTMLKAEK